MVSGPKLIFRILMISSLVLFATSCTFIKKKLDLSGIDDISEAILRDYQVEDRQELENYLGEKGYQYDTNEGDLEDIEVSKLDTWTLDRPIIQEKIRFPSTLKKENGSADTAIFYLYRKGELKHQKVILWIPGFGVSDFAFRFIKKFFNHELNAGYAVLFYNIPYHLERLEKNREMGEGLFTGRVKHNLETIRHLLYEIRTAVKYLNHQEIASISGWGGSIGGALLWLSSTTIEYDHLTLMIPIVDWNTIIFHKNMQEVVKLINSNGIPENLLRSSYNSISPMFATSKTHPNRIQILYARFDQLTPESKILEFASKWRINQVHSYPESHASILINDRLYKDYLRFLEKIASKK